MLVYGKVPLQMPKKTAQMHMERRAREATTTTTKTPRQLAHTHTKKESESSAIAWIEQAKIKVYISMEHIFHCLLHSHFICTRCTTLYDCSFFFARSIFSKSTISYHWGFECVLGIYSMENVKQHAWIYGSSQQLSNNITCYRKERKQNILPRSFRCVIFFALFILLCCCSNLLWLLLLLSMVRLWQRNVHRLYHIILFFFAQRKRERERAHEKRDQMQNMWIFT